MYFKPPKTDLWNGIRGVGLASDKYDSPVEWKLNGFRSKLTFVSNCLQTNLSKLLVPLYSLWTSGVLTERSLVYINPRQQNFLTFSLRVCENVNLHLLRNQFDTNSSDVIEYSLFIIISP